MTAFLFDTHAHLDDDRFQGDLPEVLERARQAQIVRIMTVATTGPDSVRNVALARQHPLLAATVGIQPNNVAQAAAPDWDTVLSLATDPHVLGIGETGLDRHWDHSPFPLQEDYFARHLDLSRRTRLPLVIHCRDAEADVVRMLRADHERHGPVRGVMHSFAGTLETAQACLAMGLYVSFAGMLTYKNAQNVRDVARHIPLSRVLVETDSPYLPPVPMRGKRNEPSFVVHTAACLAQVLEVPHEVLAEHSTHNAQQLFQRS